MFLNILLVLSLSTNAAEPKFTIVDQKQPAPFAGVLLDESAIATILTDYDIVSYSCEIKTDYLLKTQKEGYEYKLENLKIEQKALTDEYDLFIIQKDKEIGALVNSLKKISPRYKWMWFVGGVVVGTSATYGAYKTFNG